MDVSPSVSRFAAKVFWLIQYDQASLLDLKLKAEDFSSADDFSVCYFLVEVLSKYPYLRVDIDREAAALEKFRAAERTCIETNIRFSKPCMGLDSISDPLHSVFSTARRKIARLLGPFNWDSAARFFSFGPGASIGLPRRRCAGHHKYGSKPSVTEGCLGLAIACIKRNAAWFNYAVENFGRDPIDWFNIVGGNKVTTVPKNAKTDRVIAIEPLMNMYVQKGIGRLIRLALKRVGVDLDSQVPNQDLALVGSLTGEYATLDLSAASDSVAMGLVEDMLPPDWVSAMKQCRSPFGFTPSGEKILYRKVSSMGNGFTFELESLIFWAISESVLDFHGVSGRCVVYGDDIIVPSTAYSQVVEALVHAGFSVNEKKSFATGAFRESCGKHYFNGSDVTPFYLREKVDTLERLYWFGNSIQMLASRGCVTRDARFLRAFKHVVSRAKSVGPIRWGNLFLPNSSGVETGCFGAPFDKVRPQFSAFGYVYTAMRRVYAERVVAEASSLVHWIDSTAFVPPCWASIRQRIDRLPIMGSLASVTVTEGLRAGRYQSDRYKWSCIKTTTRQWAELGPWC